MKKKLKIKKLKADPITSPPPSSYGGIFGDVSDDEIDQLLLEWDRHCEPVKKKDKKSKKKCECGADKTYNGSPPGHAQWCAKYE